MAQLNRDDLAKLQGISKRTISAFESLDLGQNDLTASVTAIRNSEVIGVGLSSAFTADRAIAGSIDIQITDGGPKGNLTIGLTPSGVSAATYGGAAYFTSFAVNAQGRITLAAQYVATTTNVAEGANLYFTTARARSSLSGGAGIVYSNITGVIAVNSTLALYAGGDVPSAFVLGIVDSVDAAAFRTAIGAGSGAGSVTSVNVSGGTSGLSFSGGPVTTSGTITLAGTLIVANGGTGAVSFTANRLLRGNGTSPIAPSIITDDGSNVGIGIASPAAKLDVDGSIATFTNGFFYTPYNGGTNTSSVRAGIQMDGAAQSVNFYTSNTYRGSVDASGNFYAGGGTTAMTNGFFYIPAAAGAPSGVPTAIAGRVPMYFDTTNNNFYVYNGAWKKVLLA